MPGLSAQSTPNQADEERRRAARLERERRAAWTKKIQEELNQGIEKGVEEVKKEIEEKLGDKGIDLTAKETRPAAKSKRPERGGARPPHADRGRAHPAVPTTRQTGPSPGLAEPEGEEKQEVPETEAPGEGEAGAPESQQTPSGGLGGAPGAPSESGRGVPSEPSGAAARKAPTAPKAAAPAKEALAPSRRYEPTVAAPTQDQAAGAPTEQPGVSPTAPGETGQPAQEGEEKPEEEKPEKTPGETGATEKEANPEEAGEKSGKPGKESAEGEPAAEGQEETKKPYQQFTEPEPGAAEAGAPQGPRGEEPGQKEGTPDARTADQEAQKQQAADLARQRQQTRQEQKQKKTDEEERKGKTTTSGTDDGFRDLQGIVLLGAFRDVCAFVLGWIPFVGAVLLGFVSLSFVLSLIFFIKKQDRKRLALLVAKEIAPKWEAYGIAFLASHALTLIYLNRKYKTSRLIPNTTKS